MNETAIIGIDPGKGGAIAILFRNEITCWKMPEEERDLVEILRYPMAHYLTPPTRVDCWIEAVNSSPKMGVVSSFKFGDNFGLCRGIVLGLGHSLSLVHPKTWQKALHLQKVGGGYGDNDAYTARKNRNKQSAQELHPDLKVTHAIADALLILEYGRMNQSLF